MTTLENIEWVIAIVKEDVKNRSRKVMMCDALTAAKSDLIRLEAERADLRKTADNFAHWMLYVGGDPDQDDTKEDAIKVLYEIRKEALRCAFGKSSVVERLEAERKELREALKAMDCIPCANSGCAGCKALAKVTT